jgi:hypothetical protein
MNVDHCWNNTDVGKPNTVGGEKYDPVPLCPSHISYGLAWD